MTPPLHQPMDFETFARRAGEILAAIPARFLQGIIDVDAHCQAFRDPDLRDVHILGECVDDEVNVLAGGEEIRSRIRLYHGSFVAIARKDPEFDWEWELKETILHEIRHHIEDRAGVSDLLLEDFEQLLSLRE
jgi:hypothetical protein